MIFGVMDVINFAHGAFITIGIYIIWVVFSRSGINPLLLLPLAAVGVFVLGILVYEGVIDPLIDSPQESQLVAMFGVALLITSGIAISFSNTPRSLGLQMGTVSFGSASVAIDKLLVLSVSLVAMLLTWGFLTRTRTGLIIRGTADNRTSAEFVGINVKHVNRLTFAIGGALAGLAGGGISLIQQFDPYTGDLYLINAFIIVVLGGLGSFPGSFVGAMLIGFVSIFGGYYFPGTVSQLVVYLIFLGTLLLKPEGLFGGDLT
jgi:branched-chain amino acid transport system permease protein